MKKYKFISRDRGIYKVSEYKTVQAETIEQAEIIMGDRSHFKLFTITK